MRRGGSPLGLHRVLEPVGVLPQAAWRLDADPELYDNEVRLRVERLNLDAASFRQLRESHDGDGAGVRAAVADLIVQRGKMHNPVTGSGGMLVGTVDAVGPHSPLGLAVGDRVASLVSLTLTPLAVADGLKDWDGRSEQVPCDGHAVLFARSSAAVLPTDLPIPLAMAVFDVCGAPALTARVVASRCAAGGAPSVAVLGGGGKSGALSLTAARRAGGGRLVAVVPTLREADAVRSAALADEVVVADARDPLSVAAAIGEPVDITVVCVDVAGCEGGAILSTRDGGTVIFFSMATSFSAAALGAEGFAADLTMVIGNGYVPGHAEYALGLIRDVPGLRGLFEARLGAEEGSTDDR
jgi:L-erythro-3,5-diaminohexanoate dehydrogenase